MTKTAKALVRVKTVKQEILAPASAAPISKETRRYREMIPQVEKRDGRLVPFDFDKIVSAVFKAMAEAGEGGQEDAVLVAHQVAGELGRFAKKYKRPVCFRGGVLHFVNPDFGPGYGTFLGAVPRAPKIPLPGKVAHGEGGPQAWRGSCYYLSEREQQQAKRNSASIDYTSRPSPAPVIGYWGKAAGKHRRW